MVGKKLILLVASMTILFSGCGQTVPGKDTSRITGNVDIKQSTEYKGSSSGNISEVGNGTKVEKPRSGNNDAPKETGSSTKAADKVVTTPAAKTTSKPVSTPKPTATPVKSVQQDDLETMTVDVVANNYEDYADAVHAAIKNGKAKLTVRVTDYDSSKYNDSPAKAGSTYNTRFSGYRFEGSYIGKLAVLTFNFTYFTADNSDSGLVPDSNPIVIDNFDQYSSEIKKALNDFKTKVTFEIKDYNNIYSLEVVNKYWKEEPLRYSNGISTTSSIISDGSSSRIMVIGITYSDAEGKKLEPATMLSWRNAAENKAQSIVNTIIKPGMSNLQKEKALHDYVILHASYAEKGGQSFTDYGVLVEGFGVCESYSKAMYRLLSIVGIPVKLISGTAGGGAHQWNQVQIDGTWYQLDATWDDPVGAAPDFVSHKYFNISDAQMRADHSW